MVAEQAGTELSTSMAGRTMAGPDALLGVTISHYRTSIVEQLLQGLRKVGLKDFTDSSE